MRGTEGNTQVQKSGNGVLLTGLTAGAADRGTEGGEKTKKSKIWPKIFNKTLILKEFCKIDQKFETSAKFHAEWHGQIPISI